MVEEDARAGDDAETRFGGDSKGHGKRGLGDVQRRFDNQELAARSEERPELGEEGSRIGKLVEDVEREHEVERLRDAEAIRLAGMESDARGELGAVRLEANQLEHFWLQVDREDATRRTDQAGELQREEAGAAAEVEHGHSLSHVGREQAAGVLQPTPDPAVEVTGESDGTDGRRRLRHEIALGRELNVERTGASRQDGLRRRRFSLD